MSICSGVASGSMRQNNQKMARGLSLDNAKPQPLAIYVRFGASTWNSRNLYYIKAIERHLITHAFSIEFF